MAREHAYADRPLPYHPREYGFILQRLGDTVCTNVPHLVTHHSPTGYEWGYSGSGPADLALNILEYVLLEDGYQGPTIVCRQGRCFRRAWDLHQRFKADVLAACPRSGMPLPLAVVRDWLARADVDTPDPDETP